MARKAFEMRIDTRGLRQMPKRVQKEVGTAVAKNLLLAEARVKAEMLEPKHGRSYIRGGEVSVTFNKGKGIPYKVGNWEKKVTFNQGKTGKIHIASAVGEPIANDSGQTYGSITTVMETPTLGRIDVNSQQAVIHEFGGEETPKRPTLVPAVEAQEPEFRRDVEQALKRGVEG